MMIRQCFPKIEAGKQSEDVGLQDADEDFDAREYDKEGDRQYPKNTQRDDKSCDHFHHGVACGHVRGCG